MQETLYQKVYAEVSYPTADAEDTLSDSVCRYTLPDSECKSLSIRQRMQQTLYHTADAGVFLSDGGCRSLPKRHRMQESLYQTADAGDTLSDS